jgi:hypothetical protein
MAIEDYKFIGPYKWVIAFVGNNVKIYNQNNDIFY